MSNSAEIKRTEKKTENNPLAEVYNAVTLIRFAFPSMVMMVFMGFYTIADTVFVARFVNTDALSSINIVCPVINLIVGLGTMLAAGGSAVVAAKMGSGKVREACHDFTLIVLAGAALGGAVMAAGLFALDDIVRGLGASRALIPYCRDYLRIQLIFAAGNMLQVLYQNLLVTAGRPGLGLMLSVLAGISNIVFDFIFIVLMQMGIKGAALGTGIGYLVPAVFGTLFFLSGKSTLHFCRPRFGGAVLFKSCLNGASEMVSQMSAAVTTFLFNSAMLRLLGEDGVAAITVMIYSQFFLTTLYIGFSMGTAPVISYHCGSRSGGRLRKIIAVCFCVIFTVSFAVFLVVFFAGNNIAGMFAGDNKSVFLLAEKGFSIFSFSFLFSGANIFTSAMFTAMSDGKSSAAISFLRTFGFVTVFIFILPRFLQVTGVWLSIPAAEACTFIVTLCLICRCRKNGGFDKNATAS